MCSSSDVHRRTAPVPSDSPAHLRVTTPAAFIVHGSGKSRATVGPLGTMNGPRTPGSWRFRPQSSREVRRDDGAAQRDRLGAALRAGHGTGASFGFSLSSGPEPTLRLLSRDPTSVRWAARVFTTAYERPQWSWTLEGDPSGDLSGVWHGDRARPWPNPLRSAADGVPMIDAVVLVFSALPPGPGASGGFARSR